MALSVAAPGTGSDEARRPGDSDTDGTPVLEGLIAPAAGVLAELAGGWLGAVAIGPGNDDHGNDQIREYGIGCLVYTTRRPRGICREAEAHARPGTRYVPEITCLS